MTDLSPPSAANSVVLASPVLPRRRRRRPALIAAAAVVAVTLAVGIAALVGTGDDGPTYSLVDAPAAADELDGLRYDLTVSGVPMLGGVSITTTQDQANQRVRLQMDLGQVSDTAITVIGDLASGVVYVSGGVMNDLLPDGATWVRLDGDLLDELDGLEGLSEQLRLDPLAALETADLAGATDEGFEQVDGIRTKRYSLAVDPLELLQRRGPLGDLGGNLLDELADEIELLIWVDEDNLVRQLRHEIDLFGITMTTTVRIDPAEGDVPLPDPDEVVDGSDIIDRLR